MRIGQGVRLPWTREHGEAAVASAELPLPRFLQESIPAPFVRGVSLLLQHPDLSQRFSQQPAGSLLSSQDPALGCPVHGLAGLLLSRRVCQNVPSLPFRCLPRGWRSQLCAFFCILRHYMELLLAALVVKELFGQFPVGCRAGRIVPRGDIFLTCLIPNQHSY